MIRQTTILFTVLLLGCVDDNPKKDSQLPNIVNANASVSNDSIELLSLTRSLLKWQESDLKGDFSISGEDSLSIGIDWPLHKARVEGLFKTNLFSREFMENYQDIALQLDKELKQNPSKYLNEELPYYGRDANVWCNCQDYPSDIFERLALKSIKKEKDVASYYWESGEDLRYFVKTKRENGHWKIMYLEGLDLKEYIKK